MQQTDQIQRLLNHRQIMGSSVQTDLQPASHSAHQGVPGYPDAPPPPQTTHVPHAQPSQPSSCVYSLILTPNTNTARHDTSLSRHPQSILCRSICSTHVPFPYQSICSFFFSTLKSTQCRERMQAFSCSAASFPVRRNRRAQNMRPALHLASLDTVTPSIHLIIFFLT